MNLAGPNWDLSTEYSSVDAPEVGNDVAEADQLIAQIESQSTPLAAALPGIMALTMDGAGELIAAAQRVHQLAEGAGKLLSNLSTYASCTLSVDGKHAAALALQGRLQSRQTRMREALQPLTQFLDLADDTIVNAFLDDDRTRASAFVVRHSRERRDELLTLGEENLVTALGSDGIHAWNRLYTQLSSTIQCDVLVGNETQTMGLAAAAGLMMQGDDRLRRNAWSAINAGWSAHEESCAAALNAISGWRLSLYKKRGRDTPVHHLTPPAHQNRISRQTLDTLLDVAKAARPMVRRAAAVQAAAYGKSHYGPWDNRAPAPQQGAEEGQFSFATAIDIISNAYAGVDAQLGEFVRMMADQRWIEGSQGNNKRPGAYCTGFAKSRTPRVYMTYSGSASDVITLAHELGHAYHSWVMRDLSEDERSYGMSLAETASTFGETIVRDAMLQQAATPQAAFAIAWQDAEAAIAFILNIPARFQFEQALFERRAERPLRPSELKQMMSEAWTDCYGDVLAEPDPMFWASKLHFFISGLSFYNFPYLFGYLFSLGVYAQRQRLGGEFFSAYKALLRDTGRMTAEDLARAHLRADLTQPAFWQDSIDLVGKSIDQFVDLGQQLRA